VTSDIDRLTVFVTVVDAGGFAAAAQLLGRPQPDVANAISELEAESGRTLLNRVGPIVRPTFSGDELMVTARRALRDAANVAMNTGQNDDAPRGRLDLGCLPTLALAPVAPLVAEFCSLYPGVRVTLSDPENIADLVAFVRSGRSEIGISSVASPSDLTSQKLDDQAFCVVLPPGSEVPDPLPIERLAEMPLVAAPKGSSTRSLLDDVLGADKVSARIVVETAQREALLPLILSGAGSALLPRPLAESARQLGCVVVDPIPSVSRPVILIHRSDRLTKIAELFVSFAGAQ
jgi:LysR family transcriptional regulator, carnitine catabolism transcriptional activator